MKIALASGKGGTGKTFVSTNLFWVARNKGINCTLVDCDAEEPNDAGFIPGYILNTRKVVQHIPVIDEQKCTFCGRCFEYCSYNAIVFLPDNRFIKVIDDLCHDCGACSVACSFEAISLKENVVGTVRDIYVGIKSEMIEAKTEIGVYSPVPVIKKAIKQVDSDALTILDAPPGISCPFIATVDKADYVVLVTEPTPFGLNDLKLSAETLDELGKPYGVVVNRSGLGNHEVYSWLKEKKIPLLMEIPFDKEIARVYSEGKLIAEFNSKYHDKFLQLLQSIKKEIGR